MQSVARKEQIRSDNCEMMMLTMVTSVEETKMMTIDDDETKMMTIKDETTKEDAEIRTRYKAHKEVLGSPRKS